MIVDLKNDHLLRFAIFAGLFGFLTLLVACGGNKDELAQKQKDYFHQKIEPLQKSIQATCDSFVATEDPWLVTAGKVSSEKMYGMTETNYRKKYGDIIGQAKALEFMADGARCSANEGIIPYYLSLATKLSELAECLQASPHE